MELPSHYEFQTCVRRYKGDHKVRKLSCWDQFLSMAFAQPTYRESLRDIEACLRAFKSKLYHRGMRGKIAKFTLPALTITQLYKCRWRVEVFFKWIKQHLRIKKFYGVCENAVKTQIRIAISVYVFVAIVKKRLRLEQSLYTILQILSVTLFEKTPILQALSQADYRPPKDYGCRQLELFDL